jgi:hypothetical protein
MIILSKVKDARILWFTLCSAWFECRPRYVAIFINFLPSLGATAQGELWPPEQSASTVFVQTTKR